MNLDKAIAAYITLRERADALKQEYDTKKKAIEEKQLQIANLIQKYFDQTGQENARTVHGTAFKHRKDSVRVANKAEFSQFILDEIERHGIDGLAMATLHASKDAVKQYMEDNDDTLPPGIKYEAWTEVQIRKPTK